MLLQEEFKDQVKTFAATQYRKTSLGWRFSLVFHFALLLLTFLAWPELPELKLPEPEPLAIMIMSSDKVEALTKPSSSVTAVGFIEAPPILDNVDLERRQRNFNPGRIAALLDKLPDKKDKNYIAPKPQLSLRDIDAIKVQMRRCWTIPAGAANAHKLVVKIRVFLDIDGRMIVPPKVLTRARGKFFRVAVENALRALRRCEPFKMPAEKYESWREMVLIFNPAEMLEGKKAEG